MSASVGEMIREVRQARGISLRQLSRQVGIHFSHLSKIENGKDPIGRDSLAGIAEELGVAPDLIQDRRGIKKPRQFRDGPQPAVSCACGTQLLRSWATRRSWDRQPQANHPTRK
jgi:transcriptional regulator with XRE-family HTH domain